ncbi:histidine kinase [Actinosynnema sp. NPDC020468]|uniref:sensor histidine kinase n=1 Tax=Actinosynnema sp. NPDC020468 TaxID=3154488 RepID=UPI00340C77B1
MLGDRVVPWLRAREPAVDAAVAFGLSCCAVLLGLLVHGNAAYYVLSLALLLPLAARRTWPTACAAVVFAVALAQWWTTRDTLGALPADLAVLLVVHATAACGPPWSARVALALGLTGAALGGLSWPQLPAPVSAHVLTGAFLGSAVVASWAFGVVTRVRRAQVAVLAERARLLEVEREQRDRLAVLAERTRIAREMHDVVAHTLAVLIAQADGGRYSRSPEARTAALTTIAEHARQALVETRRVLGVLRDEPKARVEDVPALVERVRAGGLDVALTLVPPTGPVEPGLELVAYRIVQEGLTNVLKHAPGARAEVTLRWGPEWIEVEVADDGDAPDTPSGGHGLRGMRERAGAYGGTVVLHRRPDGGRTLHARIPVPS